MIGGRLVTLVGEQFMSTSTMHLVIAFLAGFALCVFVPSIGVKITSYL